jgi:hypothetical protein
MPKATIHKHGKALLQEDKIWVAKNRLVATPAFDLPFAEQGQQSKFRCSVPLRANAGHDCRPLSGGENVCHHIPQS